jgi:HK97 family phage major capsid protein
MDRKQKLQALASEARDLTAKAQDGTLTDEEYERVDAVAKEHADLTAQIERDEQAAASLKALAGFSEQSSQEDAPGVRKAAPATLGEAFTGSEAMKSFRASNRSGISDGTPIRVEAKALGQRGRRAFKADPAPLNTVNNGDLAPTRLPGVEDLVYRPPRTVLDVITHGTTDSQFIEYRQVISKTSNAAIVAEAKTTTGTDAAGGLKPLSTRGTQVANASVYTYADGMEVTNQELADDGVISTLINSTLTENLDILTEEVLLNGSGTNGIPRGVFNTTGVLQQDFAVDAPTSMRKAITKLRTTSGAQIRGFLLNPEDDEAWDLLKDADGRYLGAGPFSAGTPQAWGYERIVSQAIPVGTVLVGDFSTIQLLDREALSVTAFNQHKDYAQRNLVYIRAEKRAMQLIRNAAKLAIVDIKGA